MDIPRNWTTFHKHLNRRRYANKFDDPRIRTSFSRIARPPMQAGRSLLYAAVRAAFERAVFDNGMHAETLLDKMAPGVGDEYRRRQAVAERSHTKRKKKASSSTRKKCNTKNAVHHGASSSIVQGQQKRRVAVNQGHRTRRVYYDDVHADSMQADDADDSQCALVVMHNMQADDADNSQSRSGRTEDDCWYDYHERLDKQEQYHATQCERALYDLATDLCDTRRAELDEELDDTGERLYPSDYWHAVAGDLDRDTLLAQSDEMRHHDYEDDNFEEHDYEADNYEESDYEDDNYKEHDYAEDDSEAEDDYEAR